MKTWLTIWNRNELPEPQHTSELSTILQAHLLLGNSHPKPMPNLLTSLDDSLN